MERKIIHPGDEFGGVIGDMLDRYGKKPELPLSSLPRINARIWGLRKKTLIGVCGRPSQGKSVLMLQMAHDIAKDKKNVVFISLEMTLQDCIMRLLNAECEIDNWCNIAGLSQKEYVNKQPKIVEFQKKLEDMNFIFVEGYGKTFEEILNLIEGFKKPVDAIFIDYIQMIKAGGKTDKQAIDEYIKKLRNYAMKKNFCAVIGSQINRGTHDGNKIKKPEIWELKGSGALEEVMDMCFLVHWQHYYTQKKEEYNDYWIRVAKNRGGRTGVFECIYEPEFYRITEGSEGDDGYTGIDGQERSAERGSYNDS